jgi:uncharacterized membrane-anchored protein
MQTKHVPVPGPRYWTALSMASVFGANMGDFFARILGLGHIKGVPILAAFLVAVFLCERRDKAAHEAYYWTAIILVRTAATNLGDLATSDLKLPRMSAMLGLAAALAIALGVGRSIWNSSPKGAKRQLPETDWNYWLCMLLAGTLGTVFGDFVSFDTGLGLLNASIGLSVILAAMFVLGREWLQTIVYYWLTVVMVRTAGTAVGDLIANRTLGIGLVWSTALTGILFVATLAAWRTRREART